MEPNARQKENTLRIIRRAAKAAVSAANYYNKTSNKTSSCPDYSGRAEELIADLRMAVDKNDVDLAIHWFGYVPPGGREHCGPGLPECAVKLAYKIVGLDV